MISSAALTGSHRRTYQTIFQLPASPPLLWPDVQALLRQLCQVEEEPNGDLRATRNGQSLTLHPPRTPEVGTADELTTLRHFLKGSEPAAPAADEPAQHWLLVINHHEARIFRSELRGAVPQQILPHEPSDYFRHARHSQDFSRGQEKPDPNSFFEPVAKELQAGGQILIFGSGPDTGGETEQFINWVKQHHPELAARIVGAEVIDESHLTDARLLAKARAFYARPRPG
ncbi:MAG: hypothetical protein HY302_00515 [Opitutae bacterium]|nr:hypothetical protein [Opitutae bacterium]